MTGISAVLQFDTGSKVHKEVMKLASIPASSPKKQDPVRTKRELAVLKRKQAF